MTVHEYNHTVDTYADNVFRFIVKSVRNEALAQDIVQESFEKLWKNRKQVKAAKGKSYLFTTAYHTMIDLLRRSKKQGDFEEVNPAEYSHSEQYSDLHDILHQALDRLPEKQRHVVMLRDYEGYTYEEIGAITGLNESQVKVYIYRARGALKKYIVSMDKVI